jgi:hypothetical protein
MLTRQAFLLKWRYWALIEPRACLAAILYLGFSGPPVGASPAVLLTRQPRRRADKRQDLSSR